MVIMKFGGTSVGSVEAIKRVATIIESRKDKHPIVVVSAVGKVTDKLVDLARYAAKKQPAKVDEILDGIRILHQEMMENLGLTEKGFDKVLTRTLETLQEICATLNRTGEIVKHLYDDLLSYGEYLSSNMLACYLDHYVMKAVMADARDILVTDSQFSKAQPMFDESAANAQKRLLPLVKEGKVPVVQGFVGRDTFGRTTTLGRGGSDYSATLIGAMLHADVVEIWSDVDGVLTADPSLVLEAKRIKRMTFQEAAELAYFGAKVLHPATLLPAVKRNIPVYVLNSMRPGDDGTLITSTSPNRGNGDSCIVKSIAYKENLTVVTVTSTRMLMAHGFLASIFEIFNKYQTAIDLVSTSEVSVSMTIDNTEKLHDIKRELGHFSQVDVATGRAIVCLVGERMKITAGMPGKIFKLLDNTNIYLISQGASDINISFVIDESDLPLVIKTLHAHFFSGNLDPEVFAV
ncbi:lysine-sensitive aspartokinase 3 [candidate division KSB1 bacterium]|nr:lysine-sensitive aspartokinase 3 [candidate division KSB1 bacterium]